MEVSSAMLWCDVSISTLRPLVTEALRRTVFLAVHSLAHLGIRPWKRMVASRFVWHGLAADVTAWRRDCTRCARGKVTVKEATAVHKIPLPTVCFAHVHVDLVGPLPVSAAGQSHLLTVVDQCTRWPEAIPMLSTTAEACMDAFVDKHWLARFGVLHTITSDRGA